MKLSLFPEVFVKAMSRRRGSTKAQLVRSTTTLMCSSMVQRCVVWAHRVQHSYRDVKHNFDLHIVRVVRITSHWQVTYFQKYVLLSRLHLPLGVTAPVFSSFSLPSERLETVFLSQTFF